MVRRRPGDAGPALASLSPEIVQKMRDMLPCQSKEVVMDILGISSNTWTKIKHGKPIRLSTVDRLKSRFGANPTEH